MKAGAVIGLDLGGTSVKAVSLTPAGDLLGQDYESYGAERPGAFLEAVRGVLRRMESALGERAGAVGISTPGVIDRDCRKVAYMPGRLEGLVGLDWGEALGREAVPVLNDAQAALLGETWRGAALGAANAILLTLGTGVGGAVMVDGRLLRGQSGKAGHLGHVSLDPWGTPDVTGTPGSLEDAIGNHNIQARTGGRFATTHDLVRAHEAGDAMATGIWLRSVGALAAAIISFTNVLDPEVVIVGGGIATCGDTLFGPLREAVARGEWRVGGDPVRVVPAALGDLAGACGAARWALEAGTPNLERASGKFGPV
ncbi:MAG: ROK family protein [Verrucomicrobiae bacterium]|nr:ROK family protein [Verrucomicrobiae bacterium]